MRRASMFLFRIVFLIFLPAVCIHSQEKQAHLNAVLRLTLQVPMLPRHFRTYWAPTAGAEAEWIWYPGRHVGFVLGAGYFPMAIDRDVWMLKLEPMLEGIGSLALKHGRLDAYALSAGLKLAFPVVDRPVQFYLQLQGSYAYLYQERLTMDRVFPQAIIGEKLELGKSRYTVGGAARFGAEVKFNRRWGFGFDGAYYYFVTPKTDLPLPDAVLASILPSAETGKGFAVVSAGLLVHFAY